MDKLCGYNVTPRTDTKGAIQRDRRPHNTAKYKLKSENIQEVVRKAGEGNKGYWSVMFFLWAASFLFRVEAWLVESNTEKNFNFNWKKKWRYNRPHVLGLALRLKVVHVKKGINAWHTEYIICL